jgi:hypothetical protein
MRRALITALTVVALAGGWVLLRGDGPAPAGLPARTAEAGGIEVTATPVAIGTAEAVFEIAFNTHTVDLDLDPTTALLLVGMTPWGPASWDGDPAGGHHRSGRLTFPARGPSSGAVQLTIDGLTGPVVFDWSTP